MRKAKRILALAVALVMTVGMLPTTAFAAETAEEGHLHTEACYETQLVCGLEEHIHGEDCYTVIQAPAQDETNDGSNETQSAPEASDNSGDQGGETEAEASENREGGSDESSSDSSSEGSSSESDTSIQDESVPMNAKPAKELTCALEEHTHSDSCYAAVLVCGLEETKVDQVKAPEAAGAVGYEEPSDAMQAFLDAMADLPGSATEENAQQLEAQLQQALELFGELTEEEQESEPISAAYQKALSLWEQLEGVKAEMLNEDVEAVNVATYNELAAAVAAAGETPTVIHITESFGLKGYLQIKNGQQITLTAEEGVVLSRSNSAQGNLWVNGELSLQGVALDGGNVATGYALIYILSTGKVTMDENTIVQNAYNDYSAKQYGGGVYNTGILEVNGSTISGNTANSYGGGVYNSGTFTMNGGIIADNENPTWYGGGVYNGGTFTMNDGEISNNSVSNTTYGYGAGVYNVETFTMNGGSVSSNTASLYGGGIYNTSALEVNGGSISNNSANGYGGGIYNTGTVTMNDGVISGNENPRWYGGGVYNSGTFTMNGGEISNNSATNSTYGYGGGVYNSNAFTMTGGSISNNTAQKYGGGIYSTVAINLSDATISGNVNGGIEIGGAKLDTSTGTFNLDNLTITENSGNRPALFVYSIANWNITNCQISENSNTGSSVVEMRVSGLTIAQTEIAEKSVRILDNCDIRNNTSSGSSDAALKLNSSDGTTILTNCTITANSGANGGIYSAGGDQTTLGEGTRIFGNVGTTTGGLHAQMSSNGAGCLTIDGAVVTGNEGGKTGGVYTSGASFAFVSGAIYGNTKTNDKIEGANDFYVMQKIAVYSLMKASEMVDTQSKEAFAALEYAWVGAPAGLETETLENLGEISLTAKPNVKRVFARIGETEYQTLEAAIEAAEKEDTIDVVLGEDGLNNQFNVNKPIVIDKSITIKLNGQSVVANGKELFTVEEGVSLNLRGTAMMDGTITVKGNLSMDGGIRAYVVSDGSIDSRDLTIDVQPSGSFTINGVVARGTITNPITVKLAKGQFITAGEGFDVQNSIKFELDDETYAAFNNANGGDELENYVLISGCADESILSKVVFAKAFTSNFALVKAIGGNIVLNKIVLNGVYLDGQKGDDSNNGLTSDKPVKTFEKAKEIANDKGFDTIYVVGEITASGKMDGKLDNGESVILMRYLAYKGHLVKASNLTLTNIILDGALKLGGVNDGKSMIYVTGGTVTLGEGAVLQNSDVSKGSYPFNNGGGVYVGSSATLVMNDGATIENCVAWNGGAVLANGYFVMNGGKIVNNQAVGTSDGGYGGGVSTLTNQGRMTMNGGLIDGNKAAASGGGIALPFADTPVLNDVDLEVYSGTISNNTAQSAGGGIFIQCEKKAVIGREQFSSKEKVVISGNEAFGKSVNGLTNSLYAGGGIYINGSKSGHDNGVLQLYRVVITNNTADAYGNGLAACPTGQMEVYLTNGGALYRNQGNVHDDVYMTGPLSSDLINNPIGNESTTTYYFLSHTMLGGGASNWKYAEYNGYNGPLGSDQGGDLNRLEGWAAHVQLYNDCTAESIVKAEMMANVRIEGNISHSSGGGIGTNGTVTIGTENEFEEAEITINKFWEDEGFEGNRPEYVDVVLYRIINEGLESEDDLESEEQFGIIRLYAQEGDQWTATYKHLPVNDGLGNIYKYRFEEVVYGGYRDANGQWYEYPFSYTPTINMNKEYIYIPPTKPEPEQPTQPNEGEDSGNSEVGGNSGEGDQKPGDNTENPDPDKGEDSGNTGNGGEEGEKPDDNTENPVEAPENPDPDKGEDSGNTGNGGEEGEKPDDNTENPVETPENPNPDKGESTGTVGGGEIGNKPAEDEVDTGEFSYDFTAEGNLIICKEITANTAAMYRFTVAAQGEGLVAEVANMSVFYEYNGLLGKTTFDAEGRAVVSINVVGVSRFARANQMALVTLIGLPAGEYLVTEGDATVDNGTEDNENDNGTGGFVVDIVNKPTGGLTINKTVTGLVDGDTEKTYVFTVQAVGDELIAKMAGRECGIASEDGHELGKVSFDENGMATVEIKVTGNGTDHVTLKNLEAGQYLVTELDASVEGYTWTKSGDEVEAEVATGEVAEVTVSNDYIPDKPDEPDEPNPGPDPDPDPENPPPPPPDEEIPEPEVPLTPGDPDDPPTPPDPEEPEEVIELEEPEVPLAPAPEEPEEEIPEEDVPLADVPKTGDDNNTQLWLALALASLCGMALVGRKSDEEAQ